MIRPPLNALQPREAREAFAHQMDWGDEELRSAVLGGSFPRSSRVDRKIHRASVIQTDTSIGSRVVRALERIFR